MAYALRFQAYGERRHVTVGNSSEGWTRQRAEEELQNTLADVRRGIWTPEAPPAPAPDPRADDPSFHVFASRWLADREHELSGNTLKDYRWQLTDHLLPFFAGHRLSQITVAEVDRYRTLKVQQGRLSPTSINKTITRLAQILEVAVEYELIQRNPARGKRRRLKERRADRPYLDRAEQIVALLDAARELEVEARADRKLARPVILATLIYAGLRVGEALALRWRDIDLAEGRLRVHTSKTDAGVRYVDLLPVLRDELASHRAACVSAGADAYIFPTKTGKQQNRNNVRNRILHPAMKGANEKLAEAERPPLPDTLTLHALRHTCISLRIAVGEDATYVMRQVGHADPHTTLRIYSHVMEWRDGERERLRRLVEGGLDTTDAGALDVATEHAA